MVPASRIFELLELFIIPPPALRYCKTIRMGKIESIVMILKKYIVNIPVIRAC
jgi:hypothetical protein